jgi:phosphoribosylglycinamide formyltransferase-1
MPNTRIVVLASGSGSLFGSLLEADLDVDFSLLVTDRACYAEDRALAAGVSVRRVELTDNRDLWDGLLLEAIESADPAWIVSAGFMRIIGPKVLSRFQGRIVNTHPALLPSFPGAHAVRDALVAGVATTGCTVHFVDSGVDTGPIICQREVSINPGDTESTLHERIKEVERELIVSVVRDLARGAITYPQDV